MARRDKELKQVQREVQTLRKMLNKANAPLPFEEEEAEAEPPKKKGKKPASSGDRCPSCGQADLEEIPLGPFLYKFCSDRTKCKYRIKIR